MMCQSLALHRSRVMLVIEQVSCLVQRIMQNPYNYNIFRIPIDS